MKCQILFSRKNKKNISKCRLLKFFTSNKSVYIVSIHDNVMLHQCEVNLNIKLPNTNLKERKKFLCQIQRAYVVKDVSSNHMPDEPKHLCSPSMVFTVCLQIH